jgi:DNA polymerase III delta subunit
VRLGKWRRGVRNKEGVLRQAVSDFIDLKLQGRDEAALVWLLQRTIHALLQLYPPKNAAQEIRRRVEEMLPEGEREPGSKQG